MKTFFAVLLILISVVGCDAQMTDTYNNKNVGAREKFIFTDLINNVVTASDCWIEHDSANHRIVIHGGAGGTSFSIPIVIDTNQYSGNSEVQWLGTAGRIVANIDRGGSNNAPSLVVEVADSVGAVNSPNIFAGFRALNSNKTKTMSQLSAVTSGAVIVAGRKDSGATFNVYETVMNDTIMWNINGVEKARLHSNGNMGVGTTSPGVSNLLELSSTTKGFVLPRMTKVQRDAIGTPVAGMAVYQTDNTPGLRVYNGTNWMRFTETAD